MIFLSVCSLFDETKFNIFLDLSWMETPEIHEIANFVDVPYFKVDVTIYPIIDSAVAYLTAREAVDSVFILTDTDMGQQAIHGLIQNANLRVLVVSPFGKSEIDMLLTLRPVPRFFTVVASTEDMNDILGQVERTSKEEVFY